MDKDINILQGQETSEEENGIKVYNGWTKENINTVELWKDNLKKSLIVYNYVLEKYKKRTDFILIVAMSLGYMMTLIATICTTLSSMKGSYIWIIFIFSIISLCLSTLVAILNSILKIAGWSTLVTNYTSFLAKADDLYDVIANILELPDKLRINADSFIKQNNNTYLSLFKDPPFVYITDYENAIDNSKKILENDQFKNLIFL